MTQKIYGDITIMGARLAWKNFSGLAGTYNAAGNRHFTIFLSPEDGEQLGAAGWPIKWLEPREEGDMPQATIKVKVNMDSGRPPEIFLVSKIKKVQLDAGSIGVLDSASLVNVDLTLNPYNWSMPDGRSGVSIYLTSLYATLRSDPLELKYADVPESAMDILMND